MSFRCWKDKASNEGKRYHISYIHFKNSCIIITYNTNGSTKDLGRQVLAETSTNDTTGTMGASNTAPDNTELATILFSLGMVDISNTLAEIETSIVSGLNTFNLEKRNVGILVVLGASETQDTALGVQTIVVSIGQFIHPTDSFIHPSFKRFIPSVFSSHDSTRMKGGSLTLP